MFTIGMTTNDSTNEEHSRLSERLLQDRSHLRGLGRTGIFATCSLSGTNKCARALSSESIVNAMRIVPNNINNFQLWNASIAENARC
jgi:hypothetical protein